MPGCRRALTSLAAVIATTGLHVGPTYAGSNAGGGDPVHVNNGQVVITLSTTTNTQYVAGGGNTGGETYTAPLCWYEPLGDDKTFEKTLQTINQTAHQSGSIDSWPDYQSWYDGFMGQMAQHENDSPPGTWYQANCADWGSLEANAWSLSHPDFVYVQPNKTPATDVTIIDPVTLARYAVRSAMLPPLPPTFSPDAASPSVVNLTTWAWQPAAKTLDLSASLGAQAATAVMTPTAMTLTTNGPTAKGIPNQCQSANGTIGVPYTPGRTDPPAPGCGLKFTAPGTYVVHSDVTWQITWTSPQVAGVHTLPDVHITTDTTITAHEIQTIN